MQTTVFRRRSLPRWGRKRAARFVVATYRALAAGSLSLVSKTDTTTSLSATDATGGTSPYTYQWYRSTSSGFTPGPSNILSGQTSRTLDDTGLSGNTSYYYVLRYTDAAAATVDATELAVTTDPSSGGGGGGGMGSGKVYTTKVYNALIGGSGAGTVHKSGRYAAGGVWG